MSYEIGKFYLVPCIKTVPPSDYGRGCGYMPIMGPEHSDGEFINFPHDHWHVDWRFASSRDFKIATRAFRGHPQCYAAVIMRWAYGKVGGTAMVEDSVFSKRVKCKREWPTYPRDAAVWLPKLEQSLKGCNLKGMVCPHRGISLEGAPREGDVVTCPGHGLRWNVKTGELVT